jgi:hypothetical protein
MNDYSSSQPVVVRLSPRLARGARLLLEHSNSPYRDLNELMATALENLLVLHDTEPPEEHSSMASRRPPKAGVRAKVVPNKDRPAHKDDIRPLLRRPTEGNTRTGLERRSGQPFFVLTNRLNPFALASRILVNLTLRDGPPDIGRFLAEAGGSARAVGLRLRAEDRAVNRRGPEKRSVSWPIGEDEHKSLDRFSWSFLVWRPGAGRGFGPLADVGLATISDEMHVLPTDRGVELAAAPSAILGEAEGWTLSSEQQTILRDAVLAMPGESDEVAYFLDSVDRVGGRQREVERQLAERHSKWSANRIVAHRAALLGRLRDLDLLTVSGVGDAAHITTSAAGSAFIEQVAKRAREAMLTSGRN